MACDSMISGLVSITFRKLAPAEVIGICQRGGVRAIEWGGDVHVPAGDVRTAVAVQRQTADAGLRISAYGSYYRAGVSRTDEFLRILDSATALAAPTIRVWAGASGSAQSTEDVRRAVAADIARIAPLAAQASIGIDLEFHGGTLTDSADSTANLLGEIAALTPVRVRTYWQPRSGESCQSHLLEIARLSPWLGNVHVFHWFPTGENRHALADGAETWRPWLAELARIAAAVPRFVSIEFVKNDDPEAFVSDAKTLRQWLDELSEG